MAYGNPFSFAPTREDNERAKPANVLRDLLIGILGKKFDPINTIAPYVPPIAGMGSVTTPGAMDYRHDIVRGLPASRLSLKNPSLEPPSSAPETPPPTELFPDVSAEPGKVPLPPGFMESFPPTAPTRQTIDTNVTPRPTLSPLPDPIQRNRRGEAREAMKGAGIAALIGLLAGGGRGALAAASGYGQGAKAAADAAFADAQEAQRIKALQQERQDQNRIIDWQNSEAGRQARNEGILDARNVAMTEYGMKRESYDRRQTAVEKRLERQRREKEDSERAIDRDLDRKVREETLAATREARADALKYKRTPEQMEAEDRARRAMTGLANATTIEERQYWGGVLASAEAALGYKVAPPPARGGKLVPTAAEQARIDQGDRRIDLQAERNGIARERASVSRSVSGAKEDRQISSTLLGIDGKIASARMRLYSLMPKTAVRQVTMPDGSKAWMPQEPTDEQMAAYNAVKGDIEGHVAFLESEKARLLAKAGRQGAVRKTAETPSFESPGGGLVLGNINLEALAKGAGVSVRPGGSAPLVVDKPLTGYDNRGRRIVIPPMPPGSTVDANGYVVDKPKPRPTQRQTNPRKKDMSQMSDEELLRTMAGKK